jgi:RNA polymerase sigma-70 factor (ECF subfamily)
MMAYAQFATDPMPRSPAYRARIGIRHSFSLQGRMTEKLPELAARMNALLVSVGARADRAAFAAVFDHFAPRVKSYLLRLGASPALAEDLAQEAMLTVWRKAALFDPSKASASTWIFTIARNLRIDAIRRERRPEFDPNDPALVPDEDVPADMQMERDGDDARVRIALAQLSPDQAQVVQMSFFADKPHSQIAQELGLPLGTVKSRLRLAMVKIRALIGNEL